MPQETWRINCYFHGFCIFVYHCAPKISSRVFFVSRKLDWSFQIPAIRGDIPLLWNQFGNHMKRLMLGLIAWAVLNGPVSAQGAPVVVELYTSQGCSSCPPADAMLHDLAQLDGVIALALHVDYWDYIGWKDEFADPAHAKRQRSYAAVAGRRSVYTPQMIINGTSDIVGGRKAEVLDVIARHAAVPPMVHLDVQRAGDVLTIKARLRGPAPGPMVVQMLRFQPMRKSRITRGENAGKLLEYANIVQDLRILTGWDGHDAFTFDTEMTGDLPAVVLIQGARMGPIFAAQVVR